MLSKPQHGWTEITIGDFTGHGSYIQDLPVMFLEAFLRALHWGTETEITINEEGSSFTVRSLHTTEIAVHREREESFFFDTGVRELAQSLLFDLEHDRPEWLKWPPECRRMNEKELRSFCADRNAHLNRLINELKKYL